MSDALKIAANMTATADEYRAMVRATQNRQHQPHSYLRDSDLSSAGDFIDQSRNHLARLNDDDGIDIDQRLDAALECLRRAKALRAGVKNGLGQHSKVTFVR